MPEPLLRPDSVFALCHPRIIHESAGADDAVVIDLDKGVYYNMRGVACTIWRSALHGAALEAIAEEVERHHSACEDELPAAVAEFLRSLLDEGLLAIASPAAATSAAAHLAESARTPYRAPSLERYTDLEELLRADPIHEVVDPQRD